MGVKGTFIFSSPGPHQGIQKINSTPQSGKHKSRRNLQRFVASTYITRQTIGRANPTAELIPHTGLGPSTQTGDDDSPPYVLMTESEK